MDFSLTNVWVSPVGNTLPTTGTTANLTPNQLGIFLQSYAPGTAANSAAAQALFLAQGRPNTDLNQRSRKGSMFNNASVISKNIIVGTATATQQITTITDFSAKPGSQYNITLQVFSNFIDVSYRRGLVVPFTVNGPCIECGDDPCADLTADQTSDLVDAFIAKMQANKQLQGYLTFAKTGSGLTSGITITGVAQPGLPLNGDLNANPYQLDAVRFEAFAQVDPSTTMDYAIPDECDVFATVTKTQEVSYPRGTYGEVFQAEKDYFSYTVPKFKTIHSVPGFNPLFTSNAVPGTVYDCIVIRSVEIGRENNFTDTTRKEFTDIIYCPQAQTAAISAVLVPQIGALSVKTP